MSPVEQRRLKVIYWMRDQGPLTPHTVRIIAGRSGAYKGTGAGSEYDRCYSDLRALEKRRVVERAPHGFWHLNAKHAELLRDECPA